MSALRQHGFSLISALFILVVLAALGTFMVRMSASQHYTTAYAVQGARAFQAARSGIEWGVYRAIGGNCEATNTFSASAAGLAGFTVTVTCTSTPVSEQGCTPATYNLFSLTSRAVYGDYGDPDYVSRTFAATLTDRASGC